MSKLAVDVALLPDEAISSKAIAISERLQKKENGPFRLGARDYLPHITIFMGVLDEADLSRAKEILGAIAAETAPLSLTAKALEGIPSSVGGVVSSLELTKTAELQVLHQKVSERFAPMLTFESTPDTFVEPSTIHEGTMRFIRNFPKKFDWSEYSPHITIGRGAPDESLAPTDFTAKVLALCQLGQFCTCRKVLASFAITG